MSGGRGLVVPKRLARNRVIGFIVRGSGLEKDYAIISPYLTPLAMARTPSTRTVIARLRKAGFNMDAIVEQSRGELEIGYLTDGVVKLEDRERTGQAAIVAEEVLGWGWVLMTGYGTHVIRFGYKPTYTNWLIANNID
jgi:hypothetical protein